MCGIVGIYNYENKNDIINETLTIMKKLQHRGKDSFGLSFLNKSNIETIKKKGSISDFKIEIIDNIVSCIGHLKYRTSNMNNDITIDEICPIGDNNLSIVHNGNIPNIDSFDTKYIYDMIKNFGDIKGGLINLINTIPASYSIIVQYGNLMYILKDKYSIRPLSYGYKDKNIYISSETVGLEGCKNIVEINGGQIIEIDENGIREIYQHDIYYNNICAFEFIYFMNPNSFYKDVSVKSVREIFARCLAKRENVNFNDEYIVIGVPNSGIIYGKEYSKVLNLKYEQLILKNTDERTFISIDEKMAKQTCHKKFKFVEDELNDKKVIIIDDTIVKGNVMKYIISEFKKCGVSEIHIRIPSPPIIDICQLGIPINNKDDLIMYNRNIEEVCRILDINSLIFLEKEDLNVIPFDTYKECFGGGIKKEITDYVPG